jgi:hypothetical protein
VVDITEMLDGTAMTRVERLGVTMSVLSNLMSMQLSAAPRDRRSELWSHFAQIVFDSAINEGEPN